MDANVVTPLKPLTCVESRSVLIRRDDRTQKGVAGDVLVHSILVTVDMNLNDMSNTNESLYTMTYLGAEPARDGLVDFFVPPGPYVEKEARRLRIHGHEGCESVCGFSLCAECQSASRFGAR